MRQKTGTPSCAGRTLERNRLGARERTMKLRDSVLATTAIASLTLTGCGGGGSSSPYTSTSSSGDTYTAGIFKPQSSFAGKCESPRTGTDPFTHTAYTDTKGTTVDENNWLRSWTNDLYLWYSEVPDLNPSG